MAHRITLSEIRAVLSLMIPIREPGRAKRAKGARLAWGQAWEDFASVSRGGTGPWTRLVAAARALHKERRCIIEETRPK